MAFGHLQARGPLIAGAYLKQEAPIADGWLQTGDVARLFPDGTVEIVDRSKDVIKSGGEWIRAPPSRTPPWAIPPWRRPR